MKKVGFVFLCCFLLSKLSAQDIPSTKPSFYLGIEVGSPLLWGDLTSLGEKSHLGYGVGLLGGYQLNHWLATEVQVDYIQGKLGAGAWQRDDWIDRMGTIYYTEGAYQLKDVYSRTRLFGLGLRLPLQPLQLSGKERRFNIELAPQVYLNKFDPTIYDAHTDQPLIEKSSANAWSYAFGGDVGLSFKLRGRATIYLRSGLSWLSDEQFEGLTSTPAWRENLMLHSRVGVRLSLGKHHARSVRSSQKSTEANYPATVLSTAPAKTEEKQVTEVAPVAEVAPVVERPLPQNYTAVDSVIATVYFELNKADLDVAVYAEALQAMLIAAQSYPDAPILIEAWTDTSGPIAFNRKLSQQRAQAVASYLISKGIAASRISTYGKGPDPRSGRSKDGRRATCKLTITEY